MKRPQALPLTHPVPLLKSLKAINSLLKNPFKLMSVNPKKYKLGKKIQQVCKI